MRDCEGYSTERLHAERLRLTDCLTRTRDTFSNMLLTGQVKMIDREIEKRHQAAVAATR